MENPNKKKILLADDDASMRRLLEVILKKADFEVVSAEDGLQAMKMAFEDEISAIVADAIMPNLTGYELCRMIKNKADKKNIPVIILSGLAGNSTEAEKCNADAYLTKTPKLTEELIETLKNLL
jgi:two-component system cell cycle response regulator